MKTQATRDRLIRAAAKLAGTKGFDRTSVQEVMDEAGVGKGSLFHHFASKEALGLAVLEQDREEFMSMLDGCFATKRGVEALACFFEAAFRKHSANGFKGGCLWGNTALEMSDSNPAFIAPVDAVFREWTDKVRKAIEQGQAEGQVRTDTPAADLALLVVSTIEGGIMLSRLRKEEAPMRTCLDLLRRVLGIEVNTERKGEHT